MACRERLAYDGLLPLRIPSGRVSCCPPAIPMKHVPLLPGMTPLSGRQTAVTKHARRYKVEILTLAVALAVLMWLISLLLRG
jgi:hypothetical protein